MGTFVDHAVCLPDNIRPILGLKLGSRQPLERSPALAGGPAWTTPGFYERVFCSDRSSNGLSRTFSPDLGDFWEG